VKDAAAAVALARVDVLKTPPETCTARGAHYLVSNYDEYLIAYRDRGAVLDPGRARNMGFMQQFPHQLVLDGRVAGSWRREMTDSSATVVVKPFDPLDRRHLRALEAQAEACGRFFSRPCGLEL
jgi:hypothetical protein